ncbi:DNA-binding phosphoprotein [Eptesipox virus]|uniref:DNA-binding phosphoprotein n=1 Tax=Eptesipox virus TaxID=1329402 RepID=A0A220T6A3_9POXV|nr:DNA-binding phosphoprotein [Eptesipox virus]ASK51235.1 DNA-binding phosphoprotein [Eptesipox virus]WAH70993.1 DNA-binding phosphoprotein [Eptesipox virus]
MNPNPHYANTPFFVDTKDGKYLVLKAIKMCNVPTVPCLESKASCVLQVEKPKSVCDTSKRISSPPQPTGIKCERVREQTVPFMKTNLLENIQTNNQNMMARLFQ